MSINRQTIRTRDRAEVDIVWLWYETIEQVASRLST